MNKFLPTICLAAASLGLLTSAQAAPFSPTNVVIYRVGDGTAGLTSAGTAVFLDEYTPTGTLVQSYALPTTGATPLVASGTAGSEGFLSTSGDGRFLLLTGYAAPVGTTGIAGTASATVSREVATVSNSGALSQTFLNNYTGVNIRSASSADGSYLYTAGNTVGILGIASGSSSTPGASAATGTVISSTSVNNRTVLAVNGQLYLSTQSGTTLRIATVGTGLPTTTGQTATEVSGIPASGTAGTPVNTPTAFSIASIASASDTIYVADGNLIEKFSLASGTFSLTGTAPLTGVLGLTTRLVAGTEQIFATTTTGLFLLSDASGAGGTLTGTPLQIATAGTNTQFRGVALAPSLVPEPSTLALLALGGAGVFAGRSRRRSRDSRA